MIGIPFRNHGRLGARMFRCMYLRQPQDRLGPSHLHGCDMPEWNLRFTEAVAGRISPAGGCSARA